MADPHCAYYYYYYYYWVFATVSTHFMNGTCNIKLGNHRKENIQKRRKIGATDKHTKPTKENCSIGLQPLGILQEIVKYLDTDGHGKHVTKGFRIQL